MLRIAVIHISQETNDFNPVPTTLDDYAGFGIYEGQEIFEKLRGFGQVGGHLQVMEESGLEIELIPIIRGYASAGGRLSAETFQFFQDKIR
ncbi:MAG TPA: M81 family metallopeptidase, partial [Kaistia sp.]|nr:M81 family metallopeptidase [Kaistia sp.]